MSLVELEVPTLPEHSEFSVLCFVDYRLSFLLAINLSVLRFTASVSPLIFQTFHIKTVYLLTHPEHIKHVKSKANSDSVNLLHIQHPHSIES